MCIRDSSRIACCWKSSSSTTSSRIIVGPAANCHIREGAPPYLRVYAILGSSRIIVGPAAHCHLSQRRRSRSASRRNAKRCARTRATVQC
eukprot:7270862-Prymnesium_polylepis.1